MEESKKTEMEQLRDRFQSVIDILNEMIELEAAGKGETEEYEAKMGILVIRLAKMQE